MIKVSDYIVQRLANHYKVQHVFLIPGGGAMHLNDSFGKEEKIQYICNHHEQASAIAAEAYARTSGKLGVVNVTSGPGGLNTLTGVMGQWTDSVPVLYISGQIKKETSIYACPDLQLRQLGDQEADIISVVKPITKLAETLRDPLDTKLLLDKAIYTAQSGRPGPVWIDVPLDVQGAQVDESKMREFTPPAKAQVDTNLIQQVTDLLMKSERPVIIAGHGIRISGGRDSFLKLVEKLKIPVLSTFNGVDIIPSENPFYMGRIGTLGSRGGNFSLQNSDLVISIGSRNNIRQVSYNWKTFARAAKKVIVDADINEILKPLVKADVPVVMDAKVFIEALDTHTSKMKLPDYSKWVNWCEVRKNKYPIVMDEYKKQSHLVNPYVFIDKLSRALPQNGIVVTGNGTACVAAFQAAYVKQNQRYFWNSGCATMGYDLPAAVGASIATNHGPVVCLSGDGSFMMNMQEMTTIEYLKLPIKLFILNNDGYISMRQTQDSFFNGRMTAVDQKSGVGLPHFIKLGQAFGFKTETISNHNELDSKLEKILSMDGPVLCEVFFGHEYKFTPKLSSVKLDDGRMISKPLEDLSPLLDREEFKSNMIIPPIEE